MILNLSLKAARINNNLSQKQAAKLMNINPSTLSAWENGKHYPSAIQLRQLCVIYNVSMDNISLLKKST